MPQDINLEIFTGEEDMTASHGLPDTAFLTQINLNIKS